VQASVPVSGAQSQDAKAATPEADADGSASAPVAKEGGVYVDDSLNTQAKTGGDPALNGGDPPDPTPPFGLSKPKTQN
jgi:hypothetical protein